MLDEMQTETLGLSIPDGKQVVVRVGDGCVECRGTGHLGRTGVFEVLQVDDGIKHLVVSGASAGEIKREAVKNGMRTLRESALRKLAEGATSYQEVVRMTSL